MASTLSPFAIAADLLDPPPNPYLRDPAGYVRDVLGEELWSGRVEMVENVVNHDNTVDHLDAAAGHDHSGYSARPGAVGRDQRERPIGTLAQGEELDGQALLTRLKVAALLALLEGRTDVSEEDSDPAGVVLTVFDATRAAIIRARGAHEHREADRRAVRSGRSAAIAADAEVEVQVSGPNSDPQRVGTSRRGRGRGT